MPKAQASISAIQGVPFECGGLGEFRQARGSEQFVLALAGVLVLGPEHHQLRHRSARRDRLVPEILRRREHPRRLVFPVQQRLDGPQGQFRQLRPQWQRGGPKLQHLQHRGYGGSGMFSKYAGEVNVPNLWFTSYYDDSNGHDHKFSTYSENANSGDQRFSSYGKNGNGAPNELKNYGRARMSSGRMLKGLFLRANGFTIGPSYGNNGFIWEWNEDERWWRASLELLSNRRLELLSYVRVSEVETTLQELYKLWTKKNESGQILVELKQWFEDMSLNVILRMVAGKRYFSTTVVADEESQRIQKSVRELWCRIPFLTLDGWIWVDMRRA
ncbi:hypothetical protein FH972_027046 [Carpinus fangiana]|uniref:Uncharacterized protein n=1 Tax=Carpinus fangiana TaxID=176857 RepID=A0A5N6L664_9ROSI|nr:hypothetical protein FH972_027046 [Carpinus fangiana]